MLPSRIITSLSIQITHSVDDILRMLSGKGALASSNGISGAEGLSSSVHFHLRSFS